MLRLGFARMSQNEVCLRMRFVAGDQGANDSRIEALVPVE